MAFTLTPQQEQQLQVLALLEELEARMPAEKQPLIRNWRNQTENMYKLPLSRETEMEIHEIKRRVLTPSMDEVTVTHNTIQTDYDVILGAQSCRIYFRERLEIGLINDNGPPVPQPPPPAPPIPPPPMTQDTFVNSIADRVRRAEYVDAVVELGQRYFYVWGLQSLQQKDTFHSERSDYGNRIDDQAWKNPFLLPSNRQTFGPTSRAVAMTRCVQNALNQCLHGYGVASEVYANGCYDFRALDEVLTLSNDQRQFLTQFVISRNLPPGAAPATHPYRQWTKSDIELFYDEDELAARKLEWYLRYPEERGFRAYVGSHVMDNFLTLNQISRTPSEIIIEKFRQMTELSTTIGEVDNCFMDVIQGLNGQDRIACEDLQRLIIQNIGELSELRLYFLSVHSWHLQYLLYIRMFRFADLIRAMVVARNLFDQVPETVLVAFKHSLNASPTAPTIYKFQNDQRLRQYLFDIYQLLSQAIDGVDVCGLFYRDVFKVYNTPDIQIPVIRDEDIVKDHFGVDATNNSYHADVGDNPHDPAITHLYTVGNVVRLFEARSIKITLYRPRPFIRHAPVLQPTIPQSEMNDPSVDFLSPVTEVLHYMLKCADDDRFVGLRTAKSERPIFYPNPHPGTAKFHNYASRHYVHRHFDEKRNVIRCRRYRDSTRFIISEAKKQQWTALQRTFPAVAQAIAINQRHGGHPGQLAQFTDDLWMHSPQCIAPLRYPDWMSDFFV